MTAKQYSGILLGTTAFISGTVAYAIASNNWAYTIPVVAVGMLIIFSVKKHVKEVVSDERDLANAGRAARYAILAYAVIAAVLSLVLFSLREQNPHFEATASALSYSACAVMILQGLIFQFLTGHLTLKNGKRAILLAMAIGIVGVIFSLRLFSGEDSYNCQGGAWVRHGQPDFPPPTTACSK
jgi:uncharacterized membrane protein